MSVQAPYPFKILTEVRGFDTYDRRTLSYIDTLQPLIIPKRLKSLFRQARLYAQS